MPHIYLLLIALSCLVACKPVEPSVRPAETLFDEQGIRLMLTPGHAPVETPLLLELTSANLTDVHAEITGVAMYMGRIPLRFTRQGDLWQAEFLLGACSEPKMLWQLELQLQFVDGKKRTIKQQFHSSWR